jgi:oligoribonuclease (3'-5' exoribonuclease)
MIYSVPTRYEELTLLIKIRTYNPQRIRIKVIDSVQPNTAFTDRYKTVEGESIFFVRMPVSAEEVLVYVYNEENGNMQQGMDKSFEVISITKEPLEKKMDVIDFSNSDVRSFVNFATRFSYNAGSLASGNYVSDDGRFVIKYLPTIQDDGVEQTTPARIDIDSGIIEVSKRQFMDYTIPNRMAILLHEFSHVYMNDNVDDEVEADLNGLLIYLGLGYPRIEAFEVFAKTFINAPTDQNGMRYERIKNFIDTFENKNTYIHE